MFKSCLHFVSNWFFITMTDSENDCVCCLLHQVMGYSLGVWLFHFSFPCHEVNQNEQTHCNYIALVDYLYNIDYITFSRNFLKSVLETN